jgi:hypothetical protein
MRESAAIPLLSKRWPKVLSALDLAACSSLANPVGREISTVSATLLRHRHNQDVFGHFSHVIWLSGFAFASC